VEPLITIIHFGSRFPRRNWGQLDELRFIAGGRDQAASWVDSTCSFWLEI
jgi:hypothetical protein